MRHPLLCLQLPLWTQVVLNAAHSAAWGRMYHLLGFDGPTTLLRCACMFACMTVASYALELLLRRSFARAEKKRTDAVKLQNEDGEGSSPAAKAVGNTSTSKSTSASSSRARGAGPANEKETRQDHEEHHQNTKQLTAWGAASPVGPHYEETWPGAAPYEPCTVRDTCMHAGGACQLFSCLQYRPAEALIWMCT